METDTGTNTVNMGDTHPLVQTANHLHLPVHLTEKQPFHKPSPHITVNDMLVLKNLIETEYRRSKVDGIVITHGTDTMEETAFFLDLTLEIDIPIIMTGAMRSSNDIGSDGIYNFMGAIRTAAHDQAKGKGVLVVFNDEIHTAKEVTKVHTTNAAAFQSVNSGPAGAISGDSIHFHYEPVKQKLIKIHEINKKVALLKAYAGMDSSILHAVRDLPYDGLVIEALGLGNLPPETAEGIESLIANDIPVVLVSRCIKGMAGAAYNYPGGGRKLKELGVIFSQGLNGPKARLKLLAALMHTNRVQDIKDTYF